ncbi:hypothetical protein Bhyg_07847 [Pseudolycoriella hygida]|uniref:Uncharacterized protein n=1 Tax=Pseudolycoriella hygida TaxID=35572 RepID=A0A9Q0N4R5_9DIPT|nr:hypothetical protein Bhyg_07847 [Pseudolycoriella hygida]
MSEKLEILSRKGCLFNEKCVTAVKGFTEYVTVGIDTLSFKPIVRIYGSNDSPPKHISILGKHFSTFQSMLRDKVNGDSRDSIDESGIIIIKSVECDNSFRLKGTYDDVTISRDAADLLVDDREFDIISAINMLLHEYVRNKPTLKKIQMNAYRQKFPDSTYEVKEYFSNFKSHECYALSRYFGVKLCLS